MFSNQVSDMTRHQADRYLALCLPLLACLSIATFAFAPQSLAQDRVGEANRIVNSVTGNVGNRLLAATDPVYRNENVAALANSRGELILSDDSRIIVGENSTITLDGFVVADDSFAKGTISVTKGAFRFISGRSGSAIGIRTPLASIGIRGTIVDIFVSATTVKTLVLQGIAEVCKTAGRTQCLVSRRACDIITVTRDSIERDGFHLSNRRSREQETQEFPLASNQFDHSPRWQAFTGGCSQRAALESAPLFDYASRDATPAPPSRPAPAPAPPSPPVASPPPDDGEGEDDGEYDGDGEGDGEDDGEGDDGGDFD